MKKILFFVVLSFVVSQASDTNTTKKTSVTKDTNTSKVVVKKDDNQSKKTKESILKEQLKKQMELEAKYAKEQKFYQGKDYNLKEKEVDEKVLKHVPVIEPDYDFDITDVYRDDQ